MIKILVIEGNERIRENTCRILTSSNYNAIPAENGTKGIELAKTENPDIILCNNTLPDMDGWCISSILGKNTDTVSIPVVTVHSGKHDEHSEGTEMSNDAGLVKAVESISLLNSIALRLQNKNAFKPVNEASANFLRDLFLESYPFKLPGIIPHEFKTRVYGKKDSIYYEGDLPAGLFLVLKGRIKTFKIGPEGKEFILGIHEKGEIFGHTAVFKKTDYTDAAEAISDSEVMLIPQADIMELIHTNQLVALQVIKLLSDEINEREESLKILAYNSVRARVAGALLLLKKKQEKDVKNSGLCNLQISREDLAAMVGTASESLVRTLSDFKHENIIDTVKGKIIITDPDCLDRIRKFS